MPARWNTIAEKVSSVYLECMYLTKRISTAMLRAVLILLIYRIALDIEAVIGFITIQAKLIIT